MDLVEEIQVAGGVFIYFQVLKYVEPRVCINHSIIVLELLSDLIL